MYRIITNGKVFRPQRKKIGTQFEWEDMSVGYPTVEDAQTFIDTHSDSSAWHVVEESIDEGRR